MLAVWEQVVLATGPMGAADRYGHGAGTRTVALCARREAGSDSGMRAAASSATSCEAAAM